MSECPWKGLGCRDAGRKEIPILGFGASIQQAQPYGKASLALWQGYLDPHQYVALRVHVPDVWVPRVLVMVIIVRRRFLNIRRCKQPNRCIILPLQSMASGRPPLKHPELNLNRKTSGCK